MLKPLCKLCGERHYWTETCEARRRPKEVVVDDVREVARAKPSAKVSVKALPPPKIETSEAPKLKRGDVKGIQVVVRLQPEMLAQLDAVRGEGSRAEAIRVLLERELPK